MDNDITIKKIIKYYFKFKKDRETSTEISNNMLINLEKILVSINKISKENFDANKLYIDYIKNYAIKNIEHIINISLIKNNILIDDKIFKLVNEGNIKEINLLENKYSFKIFDSNGNTPLHNCILLGDNNMLKEFLKKGEYIDSVNENGHTLLEFACLQKDPNIIMFLMNYGAHMKKHLLFRKNNNMLLKLNDIDLANILKICLKDYDKNNKQNKLDFLFEYINPNEEIGINDIKFKDFLIFLNNVLSKLPLESQNSIINIWKEELSYQTTNRFGCPDNNLELILFNLVPFIEYPFNISNKNILMNELIFLIKKLSNENNYLINKKFYINLINKIWDDYKDIISYDYLGILIYQIFNKIYK